MRKALKEEVDGLADDLGARLVAQEYIDQAGDYRSALRIAEDLLSVDPANEIVLTAKARGRRSVSCRRSASLRSGRG